MGDYQPCTSTFDWTLSPGSCVKESKAQAQCWAHHCLHSSIRTGWRQQNKRSCWYSSGRFFLDSGLTHSPFDGNPLFIKSLLSQITAVKPFLSFTFPCFTVIAQVFLSGFSGEHVFIFVLQFQVQFYVCLCLFLHDFPWLRILWGQLGTSRTG